MGNSLGRFCRQVQWIKGVYAEVGRVALSKSAARRIYTLGILQQKTNADKTMTLHQIYDKLLLLHPEEHCSEQRVREDLSVLEGLREEGALSVRVESSAGAHNRRRYKVYHRNF